MTARCLDPACLDGPKVDDQPAARIAGMGNLCARCATLLQQRLAELPSRHDALRAVMNRPLRSRSGNSDSKRTKAEAPPIEFPVEIHDHLTAINATCASWVQLVTEERNLRGPGRDDLNSLTAWLGSQLDWLLDHPAVGDLADEMRDLSRVADGLARTRPKRYRLEAPCPVLGCEARDLIREDGDDHVWCGSCGGVWTEDQYPWMVRVALATSAGCLTAHEAAARLGVTVGTLRNLVVAGRIRKLGTVDGTARYSTDDINRVLTQDEEGVA